LEDPTVSLAKKPELSDLVYKLRDSENFVTEAVPVLL
jgi:hypothetical protein